MLLTMRKIFIAIALWCLGLLMFGFVWGRSQTPPALSAQADEAPPVYASGFHSQDFFDLAYTRASGQARPGVSSLLVAHHLLVADAIAEVFETAASVDVKTIVIVSPNHFGVGFSPAQVTFGSYTTPYGTVDTDIAAAQTLLAADPIVKHDEAAFSNEHGIYNLMPFIAKSFPNAQVVPLIMYDSLSADDAYQLGQTIAKTFPDALLIASVDMTHYEPADVTAANDAQVLARIETGWLCDGSVCTEPLEIDSNASMEVLAGFNTGRGATQFHLTRHDSSLGLGATTDYHDNTSHILGYFTQP